MSQPYPCSCYVLKLVAQSLTLELLSLKTVSGWRDFGFNLCVAPFPNIYVPNFKLEDLHQSCLEVIWSVESKTIQ